MTEAQRTAAFIVVLAVAVLLAVAIAITGSYLLALHALHVFQQAQNVIHCTDVDLLARATLGTKLHAAYLQVAHNYGCSGT